MSGIEDQKRVYVLSDLDAALLARIIENWLDDGFSSVDETISHAAALLERFDTLDHGAPLQPIPD